MSKLKNNEKIIFNNTTLMARGELQKISQEMATGVYFENSLTRNVFTNVSI